MIAHLRFGIVVLIALALVVAGCVQEKPAKPAAAAGPATQADDPIPLSPAEIEGLLGPIREKTEKEQWDGLKRLVGNLANEPGRAQALLIAALEDAKTTTAAIDVLERADLKIAAPAVLAALRSGNPRAKAHAALIMGFRVLSTSAEAKPAFRPAIPLLIDYLDAKDAALRNNATCALMDFGEEAYPASLTILNRPEDIGSTGFGKQIAEHSKAAMPTLLADLKSDNRWGRINACRVLAIVAPQHPEAIAPLADLLNDADGDVQMDAAFALGQFGAAAKSVQPKLLGMLQKSESFGRMASIAGVLGRIGVGAKDVDTLIELAKRLDPKDKDQENCFWSLERTAATVGLAAGPRMLGIVGDAKQPTHLRVWALVALEQIGPPASKAAVDDLIALLGHSDGLLNSEALRALGQLGPGAAKAVGPLIDLMPQESPVIDILGHRRSAIADVLAKIGPAALPKLIAGLGSDAKSVRIDCCVAIAKMGPTAGAAGPSLRGIIERPDDTETLEVAAGAARAVGVARANLLASLKKLAGERNDRLGIVAAQLAREIESAPVPTTAPAAPRPATQVQTQPEENAGGHPATRPADHVTPRSSAPDRAEAVKRLQSDEPAERVQGAEALGRIGGMDEVAPLIAALSDGDKAVRIAAAKALAEAGDYRIVKPLFDLIRSDSDPEVRHQANIALERLHDQRAVGPLLAEVKMAAGAGFFTRPTAIRLLGRYQDAEAADALAAIMTGDPDVALRSDAAKALGGMKDSRAADGLIAQLKSDVPGTRALAAQLLGMIGDRRAIEPLMDALNDPGEIVRGRAAEALAQFREPRAAAKLVVLLNDDRNCYEAIPTLTKLGPAAVPALTAFINDKKQTLHARIRAMRCLAAIKDKQSLDTFAALLDAENVELQCAAATALGQPEDERAIDPLIAVVKRPPTTNRDPELEADRKRHAESPGGSHSGPEPEFFKVDGVSVRLAAVQSLSEFHHRRALATIINLLTNEDRWVRLAAADTLPGVPMDRDLADPLLAALKGPDAEMQERAARILAWVPDAWARTVLKDAGKIAQGPTLAAILWVLAYRQPSVAVDGLAELARSKDPKIRAPAVVLMGKLKYPQWADALLAALKDEDATVRGSAAAALGEIGDRRAVEPLLAMLAADHAVFGQVAYSLGKLRDARAIDPLLAAVRSDDAEIRHPAMSALGEGGFDDPRIVPMLIAAVTKDSSTWVRTDAIRLLTAKAGKDSRQATDALLKALDDPDVSVRSAAAEGLGELKDPRAVEPLLALLRRGAPGMEESLGVALGRLKDPRAVEPLIRVRHDPNRGGGERQVWALGEIGGNEAIGELIGIASSQTHWSDRVAAIKGLAKLKARSGMAALRETLSDDNVSVAGWSAVALAAMGVTDVQDNLKAAALTKWDDRLREAAAAALAGRLEAVKWD